METEPRLQGRSVGPRDIAWVRKAIKAHPEWSRKKIAQEVCTAWDWRDRRGRLKDFAARSLLLKLEARGAIRLPPLRWRRERSWARPEPIAEGLPEPVAWEGTLEGLRPLTIEVVTAGTAGYRKWSGCLARYHYLGLRIVGENLGYLVRDREGREVACLLFGAAAWKCAVRDRFLEWSPPERAERLAEMANNTRFLIMPWVKVPHLASHILGMVARRIDGDWRTKYAHGLRWLETFVERERFRGTCYRAANWRWVGPTKGRSRQDRHQQLSVPVKDVYLYRLKR